MATSQGFAYDALGNRQSNTLNGTATLYTSATTRNRLSSVGTNTYGYNAAGNQTTATSRTYAYDVFGRLSSATVSGVATPYRYNGLGQRLYKGGANLARMVYDEQGQLIGEYNNTGTMLREIVWLQDIPVAVMTPNSTATNLFYIDTDHLSTPRTITNQSKQKRWEWNSDPFGSTLANENPAALGVFTFNLRFPGQYFDKETGLHYNYFRDYNPQIGRYIQSDPIGLQGGLNTYAYVRGNPTGAVDPFGLRGNPYAQAAMGELGRTYQEMVRRNVRGTDQFFHCLAACRAKKKVGDTNTVRGLMNDKETRDYLLNIVGQYGERQLSHEEMVADMNLDKQANELGLSCPTEQSCNQRCSPLLNDLPERRRPFMREYRTDW